MINDGDDGSDGDGADGLLQMFPMIYNACLCVFIIHQESTG